MELNDLKGPLRARARALFWVVGPIELGFSRCSGTFVNFREPQGLLPKLGEHQAALESGSPSLKNCTKKCRV